MLPQDTKDKLIELFVSIDDFCLALQASRQLGQEPLVPVNYEQSGLIV